MFCKCKNNLKNLIKIWGFLLKHMMKEFWKYLDYCWQFEGAIGEIWGLSKRELGPWKRKMQVWKRLYFLSSKILIKCLEYYKHTHVVTGHGYSRLYSASNWGGSKSDLFAIQSRYFPISVNTPYLLPPHLKYIFF